MPLIAYTNKRIGKDKSVLILQAGKIIDEYTEQGYDLTLRQLYYQFVARGMIANEQREYKRLGDAVNTGRLQGILDWDRIVDRTRHCNTLPHWSKPSEIIRSASHSFHLDMWEGQEIVPEIWIEKEALVGVIEGTCEKLDVPYFACRGYVSQSEMWRAARRILYRYYEKDQKTVILHLGDHDPSGIDMTRDIHDRLELFTEHDTPRAIPEVKRLALNMDQIEEFSPPPNPAKLTDSRCEDYIASTGTNESWELDALEPRMLSELVKGEIEALIDYPLWDERAKLEKKYKKDIMALANSVGLT